MIKITGIKKVGQKKPLNDKKDIDFDIKIAKAYYDSLKVLALLQTGQMTMKQIDEALFNGTFDEIEVKALKR